MSKTSKQIGTLVVVILKARNLNNVSFYKQSPYVLVRFGGGGQRTKEDYKGGQHPVWDEEIRFPVFRSSQEQLKKGEPLTLGVGVYTKGTKRMDERLGEGEVRINEVLDTREFDGRLCRPFLNLSELFMLTNLDQDGFPSLLMVIRGERYI